MNTPPLLQWAFNERHLNFLLGVLCFASFGIALLMQYQLNLEPCPLCVSQRVIVIGAGLVFLVAALHQPRTWGFRVYAALSSIVSAIGVGVAGRHVWLQHLPEDQVPACGPGLEYMLDVFPMQEVIGLILRGSGECADVAWRFLGLSIPEQTILFFIFVFSLSVFQLLRKRSN